MHRYPEQPCAGQCGLHRPDSSGRSVLRLPGQKSSPAGDNFLSFPRILTGKQLARGTIAGHRGEIGTSSGVADFRPMSHMSTKIPIALAILGCCATLAAAQGLNLNIKPGLWELTGTTETKGDPMSMMSAADKAQMEEAKPHMSPEQRAQMEAFMKQQTVTLGGPAKTSIAKVCITAENSHQQLAGFATKNSAGYKDTNCKITPIRSTATLVENREVCSQTNGWTSNSTLLWEAPNPESFTVRVESSVGGRGGLEMKMRSSGKWLGPACGNVKP
jgi:hypothetical protein